MLHSFLQQQSIAISQFTRLFVLYAIASFIIHLITGFSILGAIIHWFLGIPFYLLCIVGVISTSYLKQKRGDRFLAYRPSLLYSFLFIQFLSILLNRSGACKMNENGYVFIQGLLTDASPCQSTPWISTSIWLTLLALYVLLLIFFLIDTYIHSRQNQSI